ncbi:MAG: hypothetical protein IJY42_02125 [Clostridia bacterium]|nr:hypothetical protein [Clostridia bacterium]
MTNHTKYVLLDLGARLCAALPPLITCFCFFPDWIEQSSSATFSGGTVAILLICLIPFWKQLGQMGKKLTETSMPVLWAVIFGAMFLLRSIIDQMTVIALVGLLSSLVSMGLCSLRNRYGEVSKGE